MNYSEVKKYIQSLQCRGIVLGLDTMKILLSRLGNPENGLNIIHISGTNGKGSVGAYLSSIITEGGMTCGRFVSPCVGDYDNTFLLNGKCVNRDVIGSCADAVKQAVSKLDDEGIHPTAFLAETALALTIFAKIRPDYVIVECGMGGKDDATNAIDNTKLAVITKISLDHTSFLGSTISEIASHKAGIIKKYIPVVSAIQNSDAQQVINNACSVQNAPLYIADKPCIKEITGTHTVFETGNDTYTTYMQGIYQPENASVAIACAEVLGISKDTIKTGIKNARWRYRFERIGKFILDGAHNPDGATALAQSLGTYTAPQDTAFICACFKDKAYKEIAQITAPYASAVYCITAPTERGLPAQVLCDTFKNEGIDAYISLDLNEAINRASQYKNVIIFGTLSILSNAKNTIERLYSDEAMQ